MKEIPITTSYFILTENCNLRCTYCFEKDTRAVVKYMDEETAFKMTDFLFDNAVAYNKDIEGTNTQPKQVHITFFGGEPMLAIDLMRKILRYGKEKSEATGVKIKFSIITNGTIYNDEVEEFLEEWYQLFGVIDVQLSYDGCPEVQNMNRPCANSKLVCSELVESAAAKFKSFVERHKLHRDCLYIHAVVSHDSLPYLYESHRYFISTLKINYQFAWVIEDKWDDNDIKILDRELSKIIPDLANCTNNVNRYPFKRFDTCSGCGAGRALCALDTEGNIYPCHRFFFYSLKIRSEMIFGNIHNEEPIDHEIREKFLNIDENKMSNYPCQVCVAVNYESTGDMHVRPNDYDVKFMVILNHHYKIFSEMMEKKNMKIQIKDLTNMVMNLSRELNDLRMKVNLIEQRDL